MRVRSQRCVLWSAGSTPSVSTRAAGAVAEALEDLDGGGLAGAVRPEQREDLALLHLEADVAHGHGVPVGLGEVLHAHRRHGHPVFPVDGRRQHLQRADRRRSRTIASTLPGGSDSGGRRDRPAARDATAATLRCSSAATSTLSRRSRNWRSSACDRAENAAGGTERTWSISVATARPASVSTMILTRRSSGAGSRRASPRSSRSSTSAVM